MQQKFFKGDKNYLLEEAQMRLEASLMHTLFKSVQEHYFLIFNPLRLQDDTSMQILKARFHKADWQQVIYLQLSATYRFLNNDNQLELVFDGRSHLDVYEDEWKRFFREWMLDACAQPTMLRTLIQLMVFHRDARSEEMAVSRLRQFINQQFGIRFHRSAGIKSAVA